MKRKKDELSPPNKAGRIDSFFKKVQPKPQLIEKVEEKVVEDEVISLVDDVDEKVQNEISPNFFGWCEDVYERKFNNHDIKALDMLLKAVDLYKPPLNLQRLSLMRHCETFDVGSLNQEISEKEEDKKRRLLWEDRINSDFPEFMPLISITTTSSRRRREYRIGSWHDDPTSSPTISIMIETTFSTKPPASSIRISSTPLGCLYDLIDFLTKRGEVDKSVREHINFFIASHKLITSIPSYSIVRRRRERECVSKALTNIGIKVPYNEETEEGYRPISVEDNHLKTLLTNLSSSSSNNCSNQKEEEEEEMSQDKSNKPANIIKLETMRNELDEIIRWASIAMDEIDFGTGLELGHNLWYFGMKTDAIPLLEVAYMFLQRPLFSKLLDKNKPWDDEEEEEEDEED